MKTWTSAVIGCVVSVVMFCGVMRASAASGPVLKVEVANGDDVWGRYVWAQQGDRVKVRVVADVSGRQDYGLSGVLYKVKAEGVQDGDNFVLNPEFVGNRRTPFDFGFLKPATLRVGSQLTLGAEGVFNPTLFGDISSAQKPPSIATNYSRERSPVLLQFEMVIGNSDLRAINVDALLATLDTAGNTFAFHSGPNSTRSDAYAVGSTLNALILIPSPAVGAVLALAGVSQCRRRRRD